MIDLPPALKLVHPRGAAVSFDTGLRVAARSAEGRQAPDQLPSSTATKPL
jgi:hypothetical protein